MKPHLPDTTLLCVDTTRKAHLAEKAINLSLQQCSFGSVKLLTDNPRLKNAVTIPKLVGLEAYSKFCIRELTKYVDTPYCLMVQSDGFVVNGSAWSDEFKKFDWIGAPWNPSGTIGNGGFSWRSKKLLDACAAMKSNDNEHPEDQWISVRHRADLEQVGIKVAPIEVAKRFSFEGRSYNGVEWQGVPNNYNGAFGFHSWLSRLPPHVVKPKIAHHSGDAGDVVYAMATFKALGGGVLFISIDNRYPYPLPSRWARMGGDAAWVDNLKPLLESQDYIDRVQYTHGLPHSTDFDLNEFRLPWKNRTSKDYDSILSLHCDAFGVKWPEDKPWLTVSDPVVIPGRPIVVNRTARYQSLGVRWDLFIRRYSDKIIFVGLPEEYEAFNGLGAPDVSVPYYETKNLLEMARIISGGRVFAGNQSCGLAIAHGLCKPCAVEEWPANRNCHMNRPNALYPSGTVEIPKEWL